MPRFTQAGQIITNDVTLSEDVELAATGIVFTNTELGRVLGRFTFSAGGSTLINQRGGYIGAPVGTDSFAFQAITGSSGNDTVRDFGNIQGLVSLGDGDDILISDTTASTYANSVFGPDLGDGNDLLRIEGTGSLFSANGGDGIDTFEFASNRGQVFGTNVTGFEILSLQASGNYVEFSGYTQVSGAVLANFGFYNLIDSDNPLADLALDGTRWGLRNSDFRSISGGTGDDTVWLSGSTRIEQGIALGGGNDTVQLEFGATAVSVAPSIDGGAGNGDILAYFLTTDQPFADALANVTGFERLRLINSDVRFRRSASLSAVSGFVDIIADSRVDLALQSGNLAATTVLGAVGGSVSIGSGVTLANYSYSAFGFPPDTTLTQANILNSTTFLNEGTVTGGVTFLDGDDFYNGTQGAAGFVHGNAGNDQLVGGSGVDDLRGDAGADMLVGNGGDDILSGGSGRDTLLGGNGRDTLNGGDDADILDGGGFDDTINGGSNVDTAVVRSLSSSYTVTQTSTGVFQVVGADGTDTLTGVEFLQFDDQIIRLRPGTGVSVNFETNNPAVYQSALNNIRDFDGNALGGNGSWLRIGSADVNGDGDIDQIIVNRALGRFATVGTAPDGLVYFSDHGWAGETRVAGIYIDPLVAAGLAQAGGPTDSQRRFQNDLQIENINRVLGANDYNRDGGQEVFFALTDGTAYLRALMHADGNIRFADYLSQQQVIDYLTANGFGPETYAGWFTAPSSGAAAFDTAQDSTTTRAALAIEGADITALPGAAGGELAFNPLGFAHSPIMNEYLVAEFLA
jgi:Ca2+-binding RTX toxin-like protein